MHDLRENEQDFYFAPKYNYNTMGNEGGGMKSILPIFGSYRQSTVRLRSPNPIDVKSTRNIRIF